jgi:hypothetical protein
MIYQYYYVEVFDSDALAMLMLSDDIQQAQQAATLVLRRMAGELDCDLLYPGLC